MTSKKNQNAIRQQLLKDGTIKPTTLQPSVLTHQNKAESQAAAIAARRQDINIVTSVISKEKA